MRTIATAMLLCVGIAGPAVGAPLPAGTYEFSFRAKLIEETFDDFEPCVFLPDTAGAFFDCDGDPGFLIPSTDFGAGDFKFLDDLGVEGRYSTLRGSAATGHLKIVWDPSENGALLEDFDANTRITCSIGGISCAPFEEFQEVSLESGPPKRFQLTMSQESPAFFDHTLTRSSYRYFSDFDEANVGMGGYAASFKVSRMKMTSSSAPLPVPLPGSLSLALGVLPLAFVLTRRRRSASPEDLDRPSP